MDPDEQPDDEPAPSFDDLGLHPDALAAVKALGFTTPTPIQLAAIPPLLKGRDVVGGARTGSGKTAAFALPLLERVRDSGRGLKALILAPTRELALQVTEAIRTFARGQRLEIATVYGGASYHPQLKALHQGVPVVVGTPGRLIDLLEKGALDLSGVEYVVLDEADEMLNMGFLEAVERLLAETPESRQVALFSATMPPAIRRVAARYLRDPIELSVDGGKGPAIDHIKQLGYRAPQRFKIEALVRILLGSERGATLVFARTKRGCQEAADALASRGIPVEALHGDLSQRDRERVVEGLRRGHIEVVIATDVAARGIDVEHITHVINFDLPDNAEVYTHRIGRTGRAGREGTAITFVAPQDDRRFRFLQQRLHQRIPAGRVPSDADISRLQQTRLRAELSAALEDADAARAWVAKVLAGSEHDAEDLAAAAIRVLARGRGVPLSLQADDEPPDWSRPPGMEPRRGPRDHHAARDHQEVRDQRGPGPRPGPRSHPGPGPRPGPGSHSGAGPGPGSHPGPGHRRDTDEVELFVSIGRSKGVRAADLVGALTNDIGMPGHLIGRITIGDHKSFIGLPRDVGHKLIAMTQTLQVRGIEAHISPARPRSGPPGPDRGPGRGPSTGGRKPFGGPKHGPGGKFGGGPGKRRS